MIKFKASAIVLHIVGWLFFLSLPAFFIIGQNGANNSAVIAGNFIYSLTFISYIIIFYLHAYVLFPRLFLKKKYLLYFLSLTGLLLTIACIKPFDNVANSHSNMEGRPPAGINRELSHGPRPAEGFPPPPPANRPPFEAGRRAPGNDNGRGTMTVDIISIALFILVIALSTALVVTKRWRIAVQHAASAEADKANAELSFLKAQVNPHFLFNTLNNIYTMALMQDEHTAESIMMLSNIMRYVTDDATHDFVPLMLEADCMHNYIDLQCLRLGDKTTVDFTTHGEMADKKIAPLVLMTFIENVFKYGTSNNEESTITINLSADDKGIYFFCSNKLFPAKNNQGSTGIGISNTTKRLERLYPQKHALNISTQNGKYTVTLSLLS